MESNIKVALVSQHLQAISEPFIQMQRRDLPFSVVSYHGGLFPTHRESNELKSNLVNRGVFEFSKLLSSKRLTWYEVLLAKDFRRQKIDVVLAQYGTVASEILSVCRRLQIPLIVHFHGYDAYRLDVLERYSSSYIKVFEYASTIISVSNDMSAKLESIGCNPNKLLLNPCAPEDLFESVQANYESPIFFALGRFVDKKAPIVTLLAFSSICELHPDARLVFGGDGVLLETCKHLAKYLGLQNKVEFPGAMNRSSVKDLFSKSFCFIQHSVKTSDGDSEGTPVSILEASLSGLPVVSTHHGGIKEAINNGSTGYLVDENDLEGMVYAMTKIYEDRNHARELGLAGREHILSNYSKVRYLDNLANSINSAYSGHE